MRIVRDVQLLLKHEDTLKAVAPILFAKMGDTFDVALPYDWEQYRSWEDSRVLARTFHFVEIKDGCIHLELHPVEYMMPMQSELFFKFDVEEIFGDSLPSDGCGQVEMETIRTELNEYRSGKRRREEGIDIETGEVTNIVTTSSARPLPNGVSSLSQIIKVKKESAEESEEAQTLAQQQA